MIIRSHRVVHSLVCVCIALFALDAAAQSATREKGTFARVTIPRLQHAPKIEDFVDMEPASSLAKQMLRITNFIARLPVDDVPSSEPTEVYLGYDNANLYSVFLCFDSHPEGMRARRPSRDNVFEDDSVTIQLDTFHDQQRAYSFGVNAGGMLLMPSSPKKYRRLRNATDSLLYGRHRITSAIAVGQVPPGCRLAWVRLG